MNSIIANNIRKLRDINGYTQDDMAKALGITRSAYGNYESALREIPYDVIERAADFLGCDAYLLFEESDEAANEMLATAFRISDLTEKDCEEIARFKDIVKTSLKLDRIANEH